MVDSVYEHGSRNSVNLSNALVSSDKTKRKCAIMTVTSPDHSSQFKYRRVSVPALGARSGPGSRDHHLHYLHNHANFISRMQTTSPTIAESSTHSSPVLSHHSTAWARGNIPQQATNAGTGSITSSALRKISATTQRKFSTVTDAVSRKLSTTIWGLTAAGSGMIVGGGYYGTTGTGATTGAANPHHLEIANQGKSLASQYIRSRLKRSGFFHLRKLVGLQRLRSLANIPGGLVLCEVFRELLLIGQELERMHPKLYSSVCRQVSVTVTSDKVLRNVLIATAAELFKSEITWSRIVSLYAVTGGLAVDCVKQGHPEFLAALVDAVGDIMLERELATWITSQGGWAGLLILYKDPENEPSMVHSLVVLVMIVFIIFAMLFIGASIPKATRFVLSSSLNR